MKITSDLIKKYSAGQCTEDEIKAIEAWIPGNEDITEKLSDDFLKTESSTMWATISENIKKEEQVKSIRLFKKYRPYAAAACILAVLVSIAFYSKVYTSCTETIVSSVNLELSERSSLAITINIENWTEQTNKPLKIINTSSKPKKIICGKDKKKNFWLKPKSVYYLKGSYNNPYIVTA